METNGEEVDLKDSFFKEGSSMFFRFAVILSETKDLDIFVKTVDSSLPDCVAITF